MKALILSCGGSPEPLIFSINYFKPDFTYFLCSNDSVDITNNIVEECCLSDDQYNVKVVNNHENLEDSFAKSREVIQELQKQYDNIHVDFTGGTKPMVSGLVLAAIGEECTYSYVGSKDFKGRDKKGLGIVQNGFESIKDQRDPYDVFAVMEFNKGMDFFNKYQFEAAKLNFEEAIGKLESDNLKEIADLSRDIVEVYDSWDKFNNLYDKKTISNTFLNIIERIENSDNLKSYFDENHPGFLNQIKNNWKFLQLKVSKRGLIKPENVKFYLPDLLNNAYRRIEEGKYDDAVARLYRIIELIAQLGLINEGLINENILWDNKEFKIDLNIIHNLKNNKLNSFISTLPEYDRAVNKCKKNIGLGSKQSFKVLSKFDIDYACEYLNDKKISNNISSRNGSILAHGLNPIDKKKAEKLYSQVLTYAKKAFPGIVKYLDMSVFPKFE